MKISFAPLEPDAVRFLSERIGIDYGIASFQPPHWFCATARHDDGRLMGVLACEFKTSFDAHFNCAIDDPRCMSRRLLGAIFTALFSKAVRVTADVDPANARAVRQMERMGFVVEGYCRCGINGDRDALTYGMLESDCRYLDVARETSLPGKEADHGQRAEQS